MALLGAMCTASTRAVASFGGLFHIEAAEIDRLVSSTTILTADFQAVLPFS